MRANDSFNKIFILDDHPLIADQLTRMRSKETPPVGFRDLVESVSQLLFYEAMRDAQTRVETVETPLERLSGVQLKRQVLLVPILRAGLGMSVGIQKLWPEAIVGMLGMFRDEKTLQPIDYYVRLPENLADMTVILMDPMLATGGSAIHALNRLRSAGAIDLRMLALISAPEGLRAVREQHREVPIYTAALDRQLNEKGYILPGLGDAGDRYFGV